MSRQAKAVVCRELNAPVTVETVRIDSPGPGEVMLKLAACGVCHSDLSATNGTIALPPPIVLGHEAAGEVIEVGEGVSTLAVGDHVVSSFIYMCGQCRFCAGGRRRRTRASLLQGQRTDDVADTRDVRRLRDHLHRDTQTDDAAEHRDRRRFRCNAAGARLGSRDR